MSHAFQRLLYLKFSNIRGLLNQSSKSLVSLGSTSGRFPCLLQNQNDSSAFYHTHHAGSFSSSGGSNCGNLAAIFNSTKLNIIDPLVREQNIIDPRIISDLDILEKPKIIEKIIDEPEQPHIIEKHAHRMINLRKRKMKKHKLRKLRKRMRFEWKKKSMKREKIKEKAFYTELFTQIKTAENFSPERYAAEQREILKQEFLPLKYEKMPQWYYQELMEKKNRLQREKKEDEERRKLLAEFNKTYKMSDGPS